MKYLGICVAALFSLTAVCMLAAALRPRSTQCPVQPAALTVPAAQQDGHGGPSVQFFRHVLRVDGQVVGEVIVIFTPQR